MLDPIAIMCDIDKYKPQMSLSCPAGFQKRNQSLLAASPGFSRTGPSLDHILDMVDEAKTRFSYTGVKFFKKHCVGAFVAWPKHSGLEFKMKPTGSYARHSLRTLLSLGGRSLCCVAELVGGKVDHGRTSSRIRNPCVAVKSHAEVVGNFSKSRMDWNDRRQRGFHQVLCKRKVDIDNFVGRVPRTLVWK